MDYILWRRCNLKEKIARWRMYLVSLQDDFGHQEVEASEGRGKE